MNISNHFYERYVERIKEITDKNEIKQYIVQNKETLTQHIQKLHEHAQFIWKGQLYDNITRNYYIVDDIIIVTDTGDTALITMYRIDLPYPEKAVKSIVKETIKEIEKLNQNKEKLAETSKEKLDKNQLEIDTLHKQVRLLEDQILILKKKSEHLKSENQNIQNDVVLINKQIDEYALLLVNSLEHKNDLKNDIKKII